jgi:hypothetical protein
MELTPIIELGVSEAYEILTERFGVADLPPLDSLENEDWGRDYLLSTTPQRKGVEIMPPRAASPRMRPRPADTWP